MGTGRLVNMSSGRYARSFKGCLGRLPCVMLGRRKYQSIALSISRWAGPSSIYVTEGNLSRQSEGGCIPMRRISRGKRCLPSSTSILKQRFVRVVPPDPTRRRRVDVGSEKGRTSPHQTGESWGQSFPVHILEMLDDHHGHWTTKARLECVYHSYTVTL